MKFDTTENNKKEEQEEEQEEEPYELNWSCDNCGDEATHEIKFGITFKKYLIATICEVCGCLVYDTEMRQFNNETSSEEEDE